MAPKSCVPRPSLCCTPQAPAVQLGTESPCDPYLGLLEVDCSAAAGFGVGGGLCVAIALRDPGLGSESPLESFPLETTGLSPSVQSRRCLAGCGRAVQTITAAQC